MNKVKQMVYYCLRKLICLCSVRKAILFESVPDCTDNTKAVFDEMLRRGLNQKYDLVWMLHEDKQYEQTTPHVKYFFTGSTKFMDKLRLFSFYSRAKCMLCCNGFLYPVLKSQKAFFLSHGTPIKYVRNFYNIPTKMDYALGASEDSARIIAYQSKYPEERMLALGYPRNDVFSQPSVNLASIFDAEGKKIISWYPTYRQHKKGKKTGSANTLPIIHDAQSAQELDKIAGELGVLVVLKPHFAQDLSYVNKLDLPNIRFIDDAFLAENRISSYEFLAASDAMITDYSSVYFDYTLADKPIGAAWEDIAEYKENPGFAVDMDYYMKGAEKIYNLEDLLKFVGNVALEKDILKEERREIRDLVNCSTDGKNSQRVVDFIVKTVGL